MRVNIREILDYKNCPLLYKFRHVDFLPERKKIQELFKMAIKRTISHYYFCMIDKKERSLANILSKWEQQWFTPQIEQTFPEDEVRHRSNMAVSLLGNFYRYAKKEKVLPVAVDFQYDALFEAEENLHIVGNIDLIKVVNDKTRQRETDLVFFSYSPRMPDDFLAKIDLKTTVAAYAFRKHFEEKESKIVLCNIGKKEEKNVIKEGHDFIRARKILFNIAAGISNGIFYPSDNLVTCGKCNFRAFCLNEKAMEERDVFSKGLNN